MNFANFILFLLLYQKRVIGGVISPNNNFGYSLHVLIAFDIKASLCSSCLKDFVTHIATGCNPFINKTINALAITPPVIL